MPIKVLILEDNEPDFEEMYNEISNYFGDLVTLYPGMEPDVPDNEYFHYFLEKRIQKSEFKTITDYYHDIDLFILDINLLDKTDAIGTKFYQHLREISYNKYQYRVIIVSNGGREIIGPNTIFIKKEEYRDYTNKIIDAINNYFPDLTLKNDADDSSPAIVQEETPVTIDDSSQKETAAAENKTDQALTPKNSSPSTGKSKKRTLTEHGKIDAIDKIAEGIDKFARRFIHIAISLSFYGLMFIAICFSFVQIKHTFAENNSHDTITSTGSPEHPDKNEMEIFKPAEHIFLYLLPFFVIFGFYNYYRKNTSIYLLGGNSAEIDEEKSAQSMNLTKMIFISTIISYVLVKSAEEIFYGDCNNHNRLIAAGVLLFMLMVFFFKMYGKKH